MTALTYPAKGIDLYAGLLSNAQLTAAQAAGEQFVIHYYGGSIGKDLTHGSAVATSTLGMWVGAVYEAGGNEPTYFSSNQGKLDAALSIRQAASVKQPSGSAIYFAVDCGPTPAQITANILPYFGAVAVAVRAAGFKVGAYGCGDVLTALKGVGLIDYDWLAGAMGWPGSRTYVGPAMQQYPTITLAGVGQVDPDTAYREAGLFQVTL